jgi:predicted Zn-dependent peptidase
MRSRLFLVLALSGCPRGDAPVTAPPRAEATASLSDGSAIVWPDEEHRYTRPKPRPPAELQIPPIETFRIEPGIDVYLAPRPSLPTVTMWLSFPTGSVGDPKGRAGLASVCMELMEEGTASQDKVAFEERQADLASSVWADANAESINVGLSALTRTLEPTLDLMVEMLRKPGLRQADLDRLRSRRLAGLAQAKAAPSSLARRLWEPVVFGPDHGHGRLTTAASYKAIKLAHCRRLVQSLRPGNARLFVAGAITREEIASLLEPRLTGWSGETPEAPQLSAATPRKGTIFFAHVPGAAQSQIYVGHPGPARQAEDYEASKLMASILGGSFSGRVNMNIREDKGFAYGARARFSYHKQHGTFAATTSVRSDATESALRELAKEIQRIRTAPVGAEELERERQAELLGLPADFSTARRMLGMYSSLVFYGLPLDYYESYVQRIEAIDHAAVQEAAVKHLRATDFKVLVVGDGAVIRAGLERIAADGIFGSEGVVQLDGDGNVVQTRG